MKNQDEACGLLLDVMRTLYNLLGINPSLRIAIRKKIETGEWTCETAGGTGKIILLTFFGTLHQGIIISLTPIHKTPICGICEKRDGHYLKLVEGSVQLPEPIRKMLIRLQNPNTLLRQIRKALKV